MAWLFHKQCALCCDHLLHSTAYVAVHSFLPSCYLCVPVVPAFPSLETAEVFTHLKMIIKGREEHDLVRRKLLTHL